MNISPFKLDGTYTKLLKAFAQLFNLEHSIKWRHHPVCTSYNELEVEVYVKNKWYESVLDVFKEGQVAYVSSMREYLCNAQLDDVERLSKKILEGTFGEKLYIKSMKGGDGYMVMDGKLELAPNHYIYDLPRSLDELMLRCDLAGIDYTGCQVKLGRLK